MKFSGWYDNEILSGNPVTFPYYGDATTLYASWTNRTGASFEDAYIAKVNQEYTVSLQKANNLCILNLYRSYRRNIAFIPQAVMILTDTYIIVTKTN